MTTEHAPTGKHCATLGYHAGLDYTDLRANHARGSVVLTPEEAADRNAAWDLIEHMAALDGWTLTGWRTYARWDGGLDVRAELWRNDD